MMMRVFLTAIFLSSLFFNVCGFEYYVNPVTAISDIGFPEETMITPEGEFVTHCGTFRFHFADRNNPTTYSMRLENEQYPVVHYDMDKGALDAEISAFASVVPDSDKVPYKASTINLRDEFTIVKIRNMVNFIRIRIWNRSNRSRNAAISMAYNLGTGIPMKVDYQSAEFIYYDWKGRDFGLLKDPRLFGEGEEILLVSSVPMNMKNGRPQVSLDIPPGEWKDLVLYLPYFPMKNRRAALDLAGHPELRDLYLDAKVREWNLLWDEQFMSVEIPEDKPLNVFYASQWYIMETCLDHIRDYWILRANPFQYDQFYIRDGTHQVLAMDLVGAHDMARKCLDFFLESREDSGEFSSQKGQGDANGMALYALGQHYQLTGDENWAKSVFPAVHKSVEWLENQRNGGLLPPSNIRDNEQVKNARIVGHNLWALAGLESVIPLARAAEKPEIAQDWRNAAEQYRSVLQKALRDNYEQTGGFVAPSFEGMNAETFIPGRFGDRYGFDWGNLILSHPSGAFNPHHPVVSGSMKYWRKHFREGLFPYPERGNENQLHHYLTTDITMSSLLRGDYRDVLNDFYSGYLLHTTGTHAGCERFNRATRAFIPESNLTPHGAFAAKYIELFHSFFVRSEERRIHLCSFLAPKWVKPGSEIKIERAPTVFGNLTFHLEFSDNPEKAHLQLIPPKRDESFAGYVFYTPPFLNLQKATADGVALQIEDENRVFLKPETRSVDLKFQRSSAPDVNYENTVKQYRSGKLD